MSSEPPLTRDAAPASRRWHQVASEAAAAFLVQDTNRRYLRPFLEREASVAQAAKELGEGVEQLYYRVRRMLELGILEVVREEPRAGRAIKYYRSAGEGLFVPFFVTGAATVEEMTLASNAQIDERFVRGQVASMRSTFDDRGTWGYRLFRDAEGATHFDYAPEGAPDDFDLLGLLLEPGSPPVVSTWVEMPLRPEDAKALQRELIELAARYRARATDEAGTKGYMLRLGLTPLAEQGA